MNTKLTPGLYELIISQLLQSDIAQLDKPSLARTESLDDNEAPQALAQYLQHALTKTLSSIEGSERLDCQVLLCNRILALLNEEIPGDGEAATIARDARKLLSILESDEAKEFPRPDTPLSVGSLFTGTRLDPNLLTQLRRELLSAGRVDILCSFIKWSGICLLADELREFTARPNVQLRVITTSYMGATDLKAVEFLDALPNTTVKVSYDTLGTRLHAKAYLFHRDTGFGTAYVGSSNLSRAAMTDGLEWNLKVSEYESAHLWMKLHATFETYWNDPAFEEYSQEEQSRLRDALLSERSGLTPEATAYHFDLRPYPYQQEILDRLEAERELQDRHKHLVVAATGTGKTMIAAFDYRNWSRAARNSPTLLFIAHREEILKQSLASFRAVLKEQNFGEILVGGQQPSAWQHVFASIQSYNSQECWKLPPGKFDYVVVDEFHHAAAQSYERLLAHVQPKVLLGLTATPERTDGLDITNHFGGHISAEIRLADSINRNLLCPFQYFGVTDSVDLGNVEWQGDSYKKGVLDTIYTGNSVRANLVLQKAHEKLVDVRMARGLGFCAGVAHAEYMADHFRQHGIPAEALSGNSPRELRDSVQSRLKRREINFIFVVDIYNEGIDIPEIDTVLFLRPTESLTVFLQQLGRGLRLWHEKDNLTVLDFIGQAHRRFRFDWRFRALLSDPAFGLLGEVEQGFPHLPAGCNIHLERVAQERVLSNIKSAVQQNRSSLAREVSALKDILGRPPTLEEFLERFMLETDDLYRRDISWSRLCVQAGVADDFSDPDEVELTKGLRRLQHIDSPHLIQWLLTFLRGGTGQPLDQDAAKAVTMLYVSLFARPTLPTSPEVGLQRLNNNPRLLVELEKLLRYRLTKVSSVPPSLTLPFTCPLELHSSYTRDEVLVGLGVSTLEKQKDMREGVLHIPDLRADALFVTLNKAESDYSPTTMYEDYALSDELFHWQSQSTTSAESPTGRRYREHSERDHTILLFAREHKKVNGLACPYFFLGPVTYASHTGSRPMSIEWHLRNTLPAKIYRRLARLAVD